ncbi:MAG: tetratricopeptide repeat protein [Candidatus Hydrogenedens sp.]|nr:tetratricopeptide repeat protein [Candidatus Hydrogenedens sp.]
MSTGEPASNAAKLGTAIAVLAIFAAGAVLRLNNFDTESVWWDEFSSLIHLSPPSGYEESPHFQRWQQAAIQDTSTSIYDFWQANRELDPATMPLYYSLEYLWWNLTGRSVATLRLLSVVISLAGLPLLFLLGRALFGTSAGLVAMLLFALSPIHAQFGQEIRMYALFGTLAAASAYTFYNVVERGGKGWWIAHALVNFLLFWTHPFAVWLPFTEGVFLCLLYWHRIRLVLTWGLLHVALLIPSGIYVSTIQFFDEDSTSTWMTIPPFWGWVFDVLGDDFVGLTTQLWGKPDTLLDFVSEGTATWLVSLQMQAGYALVALFLGLAGVLVGATAWSVFRGQPEPESGAKRDWRWPVFLLLWVVLAPVILLALSHLWRPMIMPRYTMHCSLGMYLLVGGGVAALRWNILRVPVVLLLLLGYGYQHALTFKGPQHPDWRGATAHVKALANPDDLVLIHDWLWKRVGAYNMGPVPNVISYGGVYSTWEFENLAELCLSWTEIAPPRADDPAQPRGLWVLVRTGYFQKGPVPQLEKALAARGLKWDYQDFNGMQHVCVYHVSDDPDVPAPPRNRRPLAEGIINQVADLSLELWRAQNFEVAVEVARRATFIDPSVSISYSYMGMSYKELKMWPEATRAFEQALERNTDYPWDLINLGTCYIEINRLEDAVTMLRKACDALPMDMTAHSEMARALALSGRCEEALAFMDQTEQRMQLDAFQQWREHCAGHGG